MKKQSGLSFIPGHVKILYNVSRYLVPTFQEIVSSIIFYPSVKDLNISQISA
jgi:hypothetical protein